MRAQNVAGGLDNKGYVVAYLNQAIYFEACQEYRNKTKKVLFLFSSRRNLLEARKRFVPQEMET
jgi:hypothetical protein